MCKPAGTRTLQRGVTNTSLAWTGLRQNDFTLLTVIRNGSAGRESARISARRLQRSFHFAVLCDGWLDLSESCGARKSIRGTWMLGAGLECDIRIRCRRHEWSTRGWFHKWCANLACTC